MEINKGNANAISYYLKSRNTNNDALFISSYRKRVSASGVDTIVNSILDSLGLDGSAHKFRHTACSLMADMGMSLDDIRTLARHSSASTTMRYISQSKDRKRNVVDKFSF